MNKINMQDSELEQAFASSFMSAMAILRPLRRCGRSSPRISLRKRASLCNGPAIGPRVPLAYSLRKTPLTSPEHRPGPVSRGDYWSRVL